MRKTYQAVGLAIILVVGAIFFVSALMVAATAIHDHISKKPTPSKPATKKITKKPVVFTFDIKTNAKLFFDCKNGPLTRVQTFKGGQVWDCVPYGNIDWVMDEGVLHAYNTPEICDELVKLTKSLERENCYPLNLRAANAQ